MSGSGGRGLGGGGAAGPGGVVGQGDDVGVGEVGGFDLLGDAAFGDQVRHPGVDRADRGGVEAGFGPAVAEDDVAAAGAGAAERGPVAEQVPDAFGDDVHAGPLGGGDDRHGGGPAAGDQIPEQRHEFALLLLGAQDGGVQGDLVEDRGDDVDVVERLDFAAAVRAQPGVAVVHHLLQAAQGDDGVVEVGADEFVGEVVPHAELDLLAVEQHEPVADREGGVGGEDVQQPGFAAAGFACGEEVLVDDPDVDGGTEFIGADEDRVVHGQ